MRRTRGFVGLVSLVFLVGCSGPDDGVGVDTASETVTHTVTTTATVTQTVEVEPAPVDSITDIDELEAAAVAAGLECSEAIEADEQVLNFKDTRGCTDGHVMAVWNGATEMGTGLPLLAVTLQKLATEENTDIHVRIGQGWVIFRHALDDDPHKLGGVRTTFLATGSADDMASALGGGIEEEVPEEETPEEGSDPASEVGNGVWTVGRDIAPGTYRPIEPVGEDCYWAVLASGTNGDIVDNDIPGGGFPTVTVSEGHDLELSRCGTWELQE